MKHYPNSVSKALALLMALVMTLSLAVTSAFAVSYQDMNPKDDALLGTKFPVDATITLVTDENGKDVSLSIPVSGMTKDALAAARQHRHRFALARARRFPPLRQRGAVPLRLRGRLSE